MTRTPLTTALFAFALLLAACSDSATAPDASQAADKDTAVFDPLIVTPGASVAPEFLSFAVDIIAVVGGPIADPNSNGNVIKPPYDFTRAPLRRLVAALLGGKPAYLRISGTEIDETYYDMSDNPETTPPAHYKHVLTRAQWDAANAFARDLGLKIFVGINAGPGPRNLLYQWVPDNARAFLTYSAQQNDPVAAVEFGNEPNVFYGAHAGEILPTYTAFNYAQDIQAFEALRQAVLPQALFVGPGPFLNSGDPQGENPISLRGVLASTLHTDPGPAFDAVRVPLGPSAALTMPLVPGIYGAVNYHYYPVFSDRCVFTPKLPDDPLAPDFLDSHLQNDDYMVGLRDHWDAGKPMWLGETGSAACGGEVGYSDRHIATFYFLNHLAQLAGRGVQVYVRQALEGGTYGLLQQDTLVPNPDYWAALLWKRLVGTQQLKLPQNAAAPQTLRVYAACTAGRPGAVTLLALNLSRSQTAKLALKGAGSDKAEVYLVSASAPDANNVMLNGQTLSASDGNVPALSPALANGQLILPALSYAFVVQDAGVSACR
jgi:heparanase 1